MKILSRLRTEVSGATAIEMAAVLPVFLLISLAIVEFSLILFYSFVLDGAVFQAVRTAKIANDPMNLEQNVRKELQSQSFGIMPTGKLFLTTDIDANLDSIIDKTENCTKDGVVLENEFCPCPDGPGLGWYDKGNPGVCDNGATLNGIGEPGAIIRFTAYYRHKIFTPFMREFIGDGAGNFDIMSGMFTRNEPE